MKTFQTLAPGEEYHQNWHIDCLAWHLEQCRRGAIKRLIITIPPRSLKSMCASVAFPAFALGRDPTSKIVCVSYSSDLAKKFANDFRAVMTSDWYKKLFPRTRVSRKNTEQEVQTNKKGMRYSTSVGGTLTGRGGNIIVIDDPIKPNEAMSEAEREAVNSWYRNTLYSRLNNKNDDAIILVMQRVHMDDLVGHVQEKEDWTVINIPAIAEADERYQIGDDAFHDRKAGDLLQPDREDAETLTTIRETLGTYNFSAQYQQQPVPVEGNLVKKEWICRYDRQPSRQACDFVVQSWDTGQKVGDTNDYSVCTTIGASGNDYYILDVVRERLEYPNLRREVIRMADAWAPDAVVIEDASSGTMLLQDLRREMTPRPIAIKPTTDKVTRMQAVSATLEAGQVLLPEEAPWLYEFERELFAFPGARHDDQVDSLSQGLRYITRRMRRLSDHRPRGRRRPSRGILARRGLYYRSSSL